MFRGKIVTNAVLKQAIEEYIGELLFTEIQWKNAFGKTYRENGQIIEEGVPRDTVDEGGLYDSLFVTVKNKGVTINFSDAASEYIFDEEKGRPDFWVYALDRLPVDLALVIAKHEVYKKLAQPVKKGKIKKVRIR